MQGAREKDGLWHGADALVIDAGASNEEEIYSKSASLYTWLLGYEFPETVLLVCSRTVFVLSSSKKGARRSPRTPARRADAIGLLSVCSCLCLGVVMVG